MGNCPNCNIEINENDVEIIDEHLDCIECGAVLWWNSAEMKLEEV